MCIMNLAAEGYVYYIILITLHILYTCCVIYNVIIIYNITIIL
jgi:hypothetical protein